MPDYGHDLQFGIFVPPGADTAADALRLARLADNTGLDLVSVIDHPYRGELLDAWTLLSVIAARTTRVSVFPNVANLPLRAPAVLARAAASLDILSSGRVELGLGAGTCWDAVATMGGPRRTAGESVTALGEAIAVIRALWAAGSQGQVEGKHYRLAGARPGPAAAHPIGIWLGAYQRRMLRLTGRAADGWLPSNPYLPPGQLAGANRIIDETAADAGRDPGAIRRLYNSSGSFGRGTAFLQGPPKVWVEQLAELAVTEGMSGFVVQFDAGDDHVRRFAAEVVPAVKELVTAHRAGSARPQPQRALPATAGDGALGVTPTPDDGRRRSTVRLWDETTRPSGPAPDAGTRYTPDGRTNGRHLIDVHDHLRQELAQVRDLVEQVAAGTADAGQARSMINTMALRQNSWALGTYCETYCRTVTMHHTVEDQSLFPRLRQADPRLAPVIDRLEREHHVIADVLQRLDKALVAMVSEPGGITRVRDELDLLTDTLLSHLSYEERELVEPMARLAI
jgi:alkanesulfonate monooxygenase SsuD/methylene tetrahydromethanopterin reductase-like flavin-dependent oxidoreductase (luciferase family)